jgi:hypothetical protein
MCIWYDGDFFWGELADQEFKWQAADWLVTNVNLSKYE